MRQIQRRIVSLLYSVCCFLLLVPNCSVGQQVPQFTQYMYDTMSINPAYAGNPGGLNIFSMYRDQWAGLTGSLKSYVLSANAELVEDKMGIGLNVLHSDLNSLRETFINGNYAYILNLSRYNHLSFGIRGGIAMYQNDFDDLLVKDLDDPQLNRNLRSEIRPSFGLGAYYHSNSWYAGISAGNILENLALDEAETNFQSSRQINFYAIAGYLFSFSDGTKMKPAVLAKITEGQQYQLDLSLNFLLMERFIIGAAYRLNPAFSALVGFRPTDYMTIGVAYDRELTKLAQVEGNVGNYELFLRFNLFDYPNRELIPRFF